MNIGSVEGQIKLDDLFTGVLNKAHADIARFEQRLNALQANTAALGNATRKTTSAFDGFVRSIRTTMLHVATAAVSYKALGAAMDSVNKAVEFERTMTKIANVTSVTTSELAKFRAGLSQMSQQTGRGAQELAEGFYAVASVINDANVATQVLSQSAKLAAIGLGETNDISRALAASINAYGSANLTAAQASNQLLTAVRLGGAEASEYSGSLGRVVGIAAQMGISFAEVNASIATFTRLGVGADEAVTALRGTITALLNPTKEGERALASIGMTMDSLRASVRDKGLAVTLIELVQAFKGNEQALEPVIHNVRALAGILGNAGSQSKAYLEILREIETTTGAVDSAMTRLQESPAFRWDQAKAQMEELAITFGSTLLPGVEAFRDVISDIDPQVLADFGRNTAEVMKLLAETTSAVITVFSALKPLIDALPSNLLLKFLGYVVEKFNDLIAAAKRMQGEIVAMVGTFHTISGGLSGARGAAASGNIDTMSNELAKLRNEEGELVDKTNQLGTEMRRLQKAVSEGTGDVTANRAALASTQRQYNEANATLGKHRQGIDELITAMRGWKSEVKDAPSLPGSGGDPGFANRFQEVLDRLRDQVDATKEQIAANQQLHREKLAQITGVRQAEQQVGVAARAELETTKIVNQLQNEKLKLTSSQIAAIRTLVTQNLELLDSQKRQNVENRQQLQQAKIQIEAEQRLVLLKAQQRLRARELYLELKQIGQEVQKEFFLAQEFTDVLRQSIMDPYAVRQFELTQHYLDKGVTNAEELAVEMLNIEKAQERIAFWAQAVAEVNMPAWQRWAEIALGTIDAVADALSTALSQAIKEGSVDAQAIWDSFVDTMLDMFIKMLADMLKQWLITQAAMAASDYAGTGGGGGGGKGSSAGYAKQAGSAYSSASGAGISTSAMAGAAVIAFALYVVYKGFIEDHKKKFASATFGETGNVQSTAAHGKKHLKGLQEAVDLVKTNLTEFLKAANISMEKFGTVTVTKQGEGWFVDKASALYKDAGAAADAVIAAMIKYGEFSDNVSMLVKAAIKGTKEFTTAAIAGNIEFARMIESIGRSDVGNTMVAGVQQFFADVERALDLFKSGFEVNAEALGYAISQLGLRLTNSFRDAYDAITGRQKSPAEELQARKQDALLFNAQKRLVLAELQLRKIDIESRASYLNAQGSLLQLQNGLNQAHIEATKAYLEALGQIINQLIAIPDIDPNTLRPRGTGGGGGGSAGGGVRDWLRDRQRQFDEGGMPEWQRQQAEVLRIYDEQLKKLKETNPLYAQLLALRDKELGQIKQQAILGAVDQFQQFMGIGQDPFSQLRANAEAAAKAIQDSPMGDARKARMIARIWQHFGEELQRMVDEATVSLMGSLISDLEKYGYEEGALKEIQRQWMVLEHHLKLANYKAEFELLKATGKLSEEAKDAIEKAIGFLEGITPGTTVGPRGEEWAGYRPEWWSAQDEARRLMEEQARKLADELQRAKDMLADWMKAGVHPLILSLRQYNEDLAFMIKHLGNTAEVQEAAARKFKSILDEYLNPIREFLAGMAFRPESSLTGAEQFFEAQSRFREMFSKLQAGDLTQLDNVTELADQYLQQARLFTGGEGFRFLEKEIRDTLNAILGIAPNIAAGVLGSPSNPTTTTSPTLQAAVELGNQLLLDVGREQVTVLREIRTDTQQMKTSLSFPLSVRMVYG